MGDPAMLTTLDQLQAELKNTTAVNTPAAEAQLTSAILQVSYELARRCNRQFYYVQNATEMRPGFASPVLQVRKHCPIDTSQPISITYDTGAVTAAAFYVTNPEVGLIYNRAGWYYTAATLPNIQMSAYPGYENPLYAITYSGGWVTPQQAQDNPNDPILSVRTLPYDIEKACLDYCVAVWKTQGQNPKLKSERLMSYSYSYFDNAQSAGGYEGSSGISSFEGVVARYRRMGMSS